MFNKISIRLFSVILLLSTILLFSCNKNNPTSPSPNPAPVKTGKLFIDISGIINGLKADITVTGPNNYNRHFDTSVIINSIPVGTYTVAAKAVQDANQVNVPVIPLTQNIIIIEGVQRTAKVEYLSKKYGSMQVTISGLPNGLTGDVTVDGGDGSTHIIQRFTTSQILDSLVAGSYWVTGAEVKESDGTPWIAKPDSQMVVVVAGQTTGVVVNYVPKYGKLDISVIGLPANLNGSIQIVGLNRNTIYSIDGNYVIDSLEEGFYTIIGREVWTQDQSETFIAKPETLQVTITSGQILPITVNYVPKFGKLDITVTGLPTNALSIVHILGNGFDVIYLNITNREIDSLEEGNYKVIGKEVIALDGTPWIAKPDTQTVAVVAGQTTYVTVTYKEKFGKLNIMVNGLPSHIPHKVKVTGSNFNTIFGSTDTHIDVDSLEEGNFKITGFEVTGQTLQETYIAKPDTQTVAVEAGKTTYATVNYDKKYGRLDIYISGLPADAPVQIVELWNESRGTYDGLGFGLTRQWTVDTLVEGYYKIVSHDVTAPDGTTYSPRFDTIRTYIVPGNEDYSETIVYKPKYGKIDLRVTGLPTGVWADVSLHEPVHNFTYATNGSEIIDSLLEGWYTVVANEVTDPSNNAIYKAKPDSQRIYLVGGSTAIVNVKYKMNLGSMSVEVRGLPDNVASHIMVENVEINFSRTVDGTGSGITIIDSLEPGVYDIVSYPVIPNGIDSLFPDPDSIQVNVTAGNVTNVQINYLGYLFKVISDPKFPRQELFYRDICDGTEDRLLFYSDTVSSIQGGYVSSDCRIIGRDITLIGSSKFYEVAGPYSSGSLTEDIVIDNDLDKVTITQAIEGLSIQPSCTEVGFGFLNIFSEYNVAYNQYTTSPLTIEIENPFEDTILVHVNGTGNATLNFTALHEPSDLFVQCSNAFYYSFSTCSYLNPLLPLNRIEQLTVGATAWNDTTITANQMNLTDTIIEISTEKLLSFKFYRPANGIARSGYVNNKSSYSSMFELTTDINIWFERKRVQR